MTHNSSVFAAYPNRRGFSLVEILVSISILSLLVVLLSYISVQTLGAWNRTRARLEAGEASRPLEQTLLLDLATLDLRNGLPAFPDDPSASGKSLLGFVTHQPAHPSSERPLSYVVYQWDPTNAELLRDTRPYNWEGSQHRPPFGDGAPDPASDSEFLLQPPIKGVLAFAVTFQEDDATTTLEYSPERTRYARIGWVQCSPEMARILEDRGQLKTVIDGLALEGNQYRTAFHTSWQQRIDGLASDGLLSPDLAGSLRIGQIIQPLPLRGE